MPLAAPLAVLTFFAGFIPIVGALAAGGLAVLVALVSNGPTTALIVLAIIVVVQQLESNVLQPVLQGRSLKLHAAIVLIAVTAGGTLFGIIGAFLAVPLVAVSAAVLRYVSEQISLRTGEVQANDIQAATPEGSRAARQGEQAARRFRRLTPTPPGESRRLTGLPRLAAPGRTDPAARTKARWTAAASGRRPAVLGWGGTRNRLRWPGWTARVVLGGHEAGQFASASTSTASVAEEECRPHSNAPTEPFGYG